MRLRLWLRLWTAVVLLAAAVGCHHGAIVDTSPKPQGVGGTIAGTVTAGNGSVAVSGRTVTAIDDTTGAHIVASTASNGGYSMKVPPGKYHLELELRPGETLESRPAATEVNTGDLDPRRDFIITRK